ncbi:MAG: virulence protein RhuM/Fic/DOC family protein, partial [Candidatus Pacebacteria bacterium]|nr:virulence protein RhuM/Fic/DOC family protein [Candidatus Paceibacterota bacterium]
MKKEKVKKKDKNVVIYQAKNGAIELRGDISHDTIWATQAQMAKMFGVNSPAITKHIKNIYKEKELFQNSTCSKMEQVRMEGKREVKRTVEIYNLEVLIAVGYRINSVVGTKFRQWATKTLREHITKGYTVNRKQIGKNYDEFMKAVEDIQLLLPEHVTLDPKNILELIKEFAGTWVSLDAYDKDELVVRGASKKRVKITSAELLDVIDDLKKVLMKKGEATDMFAAERAHGSVEGIVGNVVQSFGGRSVYPTIEEKAAHLLYFMVKNHPFTDGNKRSGAFAFVWFLRKAGVKGNK